MTNSLINCKLTLEDLQLFYLLVEKEVKLTDKHLVDTIKDKKVTAEFYNSLLEKKNSLLRAKNNISRYYGELHA
jgi:hypothetical protein